MTVDNELLAELRALLPSSPSVGELGSAEAAEVAEHVRRRFVSEGERVWWWESLNSESVTVPYGDADGLEWLAKLVPSGEVVRLVVTDDEVGPWPVFEGEAQGMWQLLRELRYFEYFVTSARFDWVVFDTHHNALVATGTLLERARALLDSAVGDDDPP